jgi:2-keto-4-pentenoate hydratase
MLTGLQVEQAVDALLAVRRQHTAISALPIDSRPATLADAYRIQRAYDGKVEDRVIGYKIGAASAASQKLVGATEPFLASVHARACFQSPARLSIDDFFAPGVEAEYAFEIGSDLPARAEPYTRGELEQAIAAVRPIIEICDNRFVDWRSVGLMQIIADNGFFGALVLGERVTDWRNHDLGALEVVMSLDGVERGRACCTQVLGNPIDNVVWIANELSKQSIGLKPGQLIPIGTWTGLHFVQRGSRVRATFGPLESVEIEFR